MKNSSDCLYVCFSILGYRDAKREDTFQPIIDFSYGLDDEIRPKLTPGAGTQVQYSTALWLHGHGGNVVRRVGLPKI